MSKIIGCRSCIEPDCTNCNMYILEQALKKGQLDFLMDNTHTIQILYDGWENLGIVRRRKKSLHHLNKS